MKLKIIPARTGYLWVKSGFSLFFFKPSGFIGFFASFMLLLILLGMIPIIGNYLAMLAFPALTLGMMVIGNECVKIKKGALLPNALPPMAMAWITLRHSFKPLLQMGVWFACGFAVVLLVGAAFDGGEFASFYLQGGALSKELVLKPGFQTAVIVTTLLYFPLAAIFWFAPALMNWKKFSVGKSVFFSSYAVLKNWRAFGMYVLTWAAAFSLISAGVLLIASLTIGGAGAAFLMMPVMVMLSSIFMASTFPTFVDCFEHEESTRSN
jgi:hypothetical protein